MTPDAVERVKSAGVEWERGLEQTKKQTKQCFFPEERKKKRGSWLVSPKWSHCRNITQRKTAILATTNFSFFHRMCEQIVSKGAILVMVLLASLLEMAAPIEAPAGE